MVEAVNRLMDSKQKFSFNIQWKIVLIGVVIIAAFVTLILAFVLPHMAKVMHEEKQLETKEQVQVVWNTLNSYYELEQSGELTREEAQNLAIHLVSNIRYGENLDNYFWLQDFTPVMVMHPINTEQDGTNLSNTADTRGNLLYVEFARICQAQGEGHNTYYREYANTGREEEKTSYVKAFEPWGWIVGTGIFTVDVDETIAESRNEVILISSIITIIAIIFLFVFSGAIAKNIKKVAAVADKLAMGDANQEVNIKSGDETGMMANSLSKVIDYLKEMSQAAEKIAVGDLTVQVTPKSEKDTLGNAFSMMITNLVSLVTQIKTCAKAMTESTVQLADASEQSGSASTQVASVAQQVAKGSEDQSRSIHEANDAVEQLGKAIDLVTNGAQEQARAVDEAMTIVQQVSTASEQTANNAQEAASGAMQASDIAREGADTVEKTIEGMGKINTSMQDVSQKITELGKHSEEIGSMIAVIDDIAAQTNLLALNAAIEAARAGEQGRGFAVVADEVKKLAERTAKETQEIAALVDSVQKGVADCVKASKEGSQQTEEGTGLANEAGMALNQIMDAVKTMVNQIEQISAAGQEMSASSGEMVKVVENVSKIGEQTAAAMEQMAANKTQLADATNAVAGVTEENSAATEEMSASAEEMSAQVQQVVASTQALTAIAQELQAAVVRFKIKGDGKAGHDSPAGHRAKDATTVTNGNGNGNGKGKDLADHQLVKV